MLQKIFFFSVLFFIGFVSQVFAAPSQTQTAIQVGNNSSQVIPNTVIDSYNSQYNGSLNYGMTVGQAQSAGLLSDGVDGPITNYVSGLGQSTGLGRDSGGGDITSTSFTVDVGIFSPLGRGLVEGGSSGNVENLLARILNVLIVIFGVAAVFFMTLGAGYMIIYHGQDELLSKGKTIFTSGLIALVVALSAGLIVRLFIYLLYTT